MIEAWAPTIVALLALGGMFYYMKTSNERIDKEIKDIELQREVNKDLYLRKQEHTLLCENSQLKTHQHITDEITKLQDVLFKAIRQIQSDIGEIKKNGESKQEL